MAFSGWFRVSRPFTFWVHYTRLTKKRLSGFSKGPIRFFAGQRMATTERSRAVVARLRIAGLRRRVAGQKRAAAARSRDFRDRDEAKTQKSIVATGKAPITSQAV